MAAPVPTADIIRFTDADWRIMRGWKAAAPGLWSFDVQDERQMTGREVVQVHNDIDPTADTLFLFPSMRCDPGEPRRADGICQRLRDHLHAVAPLPRRVWEIIERTAAERAC